MYQFNHDPDWRALAGNPNRQQIAAERFYVICNHGTRPDWSEPIRPGVYLENYTVDAFGVYTFTPNTEGK
jgi:hypothetical protein